MCLRGSSPKIWVQNPTLLFTCCVVAGGCNLHPWSFIFSTVKNGLAFLVLRLYDYLITKFTLSTNHHGTKHSKMTTLLSTNSLIKLVVLFCFLVKRNGSHLCWIADTRVSSLHSLHVSFPGILTSSLESKYYQDP